jgi:hypothetical protein
MRLARIGTAGVCSLLLTLACTAGPQSSAQQRAEVPTLPGAQLALAEIVRSKVGEGFTYRLQATGLPQGKTYRLELRRLGGQVGQMPIGTLRVDAAGGLVTERGFRLEQHALGTGGPVLKGEPLELALVAEDGSGQVVARIIPAPIEARGTGDCRLSVELMEPTGKIFMIRGEGFDPGEEVRLLDISEDEVMGDSKRISSTGRFELVILPAVVGKAGGEASISAIGRACSVPALPYKWGIAMERASTPDQAPAQAHAAPPEAELEVQQGLFRTVADEFITAAAAGDAIRAARMISPAAKAKNGPEGLDRFLTGEVLPFFAHFKKVGSSVTITRTADVPGFAYYMYMVTKTDELRPFVIYVVEEGGAKVVANILVDHLVKNRHCILVGARWKCPDFS